MVDDQTGRAVWVVGLPGCGKSTVAKGLRHHLEAGGKHVILLEMDQRRKKYFPKPTYSAQEREQAYAMFVDEAADLVQQGHFVIMDGAAYKRSFRTYARQRISRFAEIILNCSLEEAMEREAGRPEGKVMADLYEKALRRKKTGQQIEGLGEVIGVDVKFEPNTDAELVIDNIDLSKEECLEKALHFLDTWLASD